MKKSDNETTTANSQPRQDGPELVGAEEAPALPPGFATAVGGGKGGSTTNQTSLLKDKKAKAKKRDKNEIVRPGAQAVQAPAPTTTTMGLEVVGEGPSPAPSELVRGTNNNSKSSANNATSNDTYFTRLGKKTAKESNQSKIAAKNKPPLPLSSMTPPPSTNTNTTNFINAEVEPINNAPRPTPLVLEEEFAPAPTWHDANVLQQRVTAMDRMSAVNLDIEQEQRHRHDQHNNQHQNPRQQPVDVENQGPATPHRGFPFYDSFRKRRSSSQLRLALCCIINLILVAVVIALSIKIATDKCPEIEGASSNKIQSDSSTSAGGGDTSAGGTMDGTTTDATTESTATSTSDLPSICLASKFVTSLFPENSTITTTCTNGCNIRMAIHKDHSIISVNNNLHFFSFQNKTWEEVTTVEMHSSNTDMPLSLYGNVAVVGAPYETKDTTSGAAYIFEREDGTGAWKQVDQFEKGWEDGDIEMEAGTIKWFGQTVAVHENLVAVGAYAELGTINPTFFFRRNKFGSWNRETFSSLTNDRYRSVSKVAIGGEDAFLALTTLTSLPYQVENDGVVFLFQDLGSGTMTLFQKLKSKDYDCKYFGKTAEILGDGSIMLSCMAQDDIGSILYFNKTDVDDTQYTLQQTVYDGAASNNNDWFAADGTSNDKALAIHRGSSTIGFYASSSGEEWNEATLANPINGSTSEGSIAVSESAMLVQTADNVHVYTLDESDEC